MSDAPGRPGIPPRWTSSAKSGVGTARGGRVWFTISHGILNEIYYPRIDLACTRDFGFLISSEEGLFLEEKRDATHEYRWLDGFTPGFTIVNDLGGHRIEKTIIADPVYDALLQKVRYEPPDEGPYHLTALLAPHLVNRGSDNNAWLDDYKGVPMLFASGSGTTLALAATVPWTARSVGFVGSSDAWQDVHRHGRMTWHWDHARGGNVALGGEVEWGTDPLVLGIGFGSNVAEAGYQVRSSLARGFEAAKRRFIAGWSVDAPDSDDDLEAASIRVLETHESAGFPGGFIASLSIPWGFSKGDDDIGGYHLVWARDLVESATGLLSAGRTAAAARVLEYLRATQEADGHWSQNMWLDGTPYWTGVQMDETALPILAVDLASRCDIPVDSYWPMIRRAAAFLLLNGPVSPEDRWEEDPGYSPFTLATEVAALIAAARFAEVAGEHTAASLFREVADSWNAQIEKWLYATDTPLARRVGVDGYYVRIAPPDTDSPEEGWVPIKNRPPTKSLAPPAEIVSPDALALVRFGLRAADDPRIVSTVRVIDSLLKVELPQGPVWRRYNEDGYGEHEDGAPFDGTGVGRPWPLLTGERAHFELAAGRTKEARRLSDTMRNSAPDLLLPEQSWDAPDIPERELRTGHPAGSAMPLCWAHAEYLRLCRSLRDGAIFDVPRDAFDRYVTGSVRSAVVVWNRSQKCRSIPQGMGLRILLAEQATIRWTSDSWATIQDVPTTDTGLGVHTATLPTEQLDEGSEVVFTFEFEDHWEGADYEVAIDSASVGE